jgi:hypothetical protein
MRRLVLAKQLAKGEIVTEKALEQELIGLEQKFWKSKEEKDLDAV